MSVTRTDSELAAYQLGVKAGIAAASWIIDGNRSRADYMTILELIDNGDPRADEKLPARPDLSGHELTPQSLAAEITGRDWQDIPAEIMETLADAWEEGVSDAFEPECERLLRDATREG